MTVAILLDHSGDIEAQSDRTKDTALSLACSGGRQEVIISNQLHVLVHEAAHFSFGKVTALGVLCCFAFLFV